MTRSLPYAWPMLALLIAAGCTQRAETVDPQLLAEHRERLLFSDEPDGVVGVLDVREMFAGPHSASEAGAEALPEEASPEPAVSSEPPQRVVVVGRIGGMPNPWKAARPDYPWTAGRAEFVIADPAAAAEIEDHGHAHDDPDHDCPFCAQAAKSDAVAVIRFKDDAGKIIPVDARQLFDLKGEETVVVRGRPQILGDPKNGVLVVEADGLYVRR